MALLVQDEYPCGNCEYGTLRIERATLVRRYGQHLLTVPNVPTWKCDVCNWMEYEQNALERLNAVIGPVARAIDVYARRTHGKRPEPSRFPHGIRRGEV